jgi:hypothetical protein
MQNRHTLLILGLLCELRLLKIGLIREFVAVELKLGQVLLLTVCEFGLPLLKVRVLNRGLGVDLCEGIATGCCVEFLLLRQFGLLELRLLREQPLKLSMSNIEKC